MGDEKGKVFSIPLDSTAIKGKYSRTLRFNAIATNSKKKQFLTFNDPNGINGKYRIPLGKVTPDPTGTHSTGVNVSVPLIPLLYSTSDLNKDKGQKIREGWLYVYVNGYLWRELEVIKNGRMRDVNLYTYHHTYDRKATVEQDTRVVVPHKIDGEELTVEMCYSEVQWGWEYINSMGGMDPIDPRLGDNAPANNTGKADAAVNRSKRMTKITNLADSLTGYQGNDSAEIIHISKVKDHQIRSMHQKSQLGAVFLHDPIGIATQLKTEHLRTSFEYENTKHYIATEEYSLAIFANELMAAEKNALQA
ncbi:MAG: hypothetical protein ACC707_17560, partial [Thiohalomonadales bacterium]